MERGRRLEGISAPQRLHRQYSTRRRARQQRLVTRCPRPTGLCQHGDRRIARRAVDHPQPNLKPSSASTTANASTARMMLLCRQWRPVFYRPALWAGAAAARPKEGAFLSGRVPPQRRWSTHVADRCHPIPQRHRLSVDEKTLYVAESSRQPRIHAFDFQLMARLAKATSFLTRALCAPPVNAAAATASSLMPPATCSPPDRAACWSFRRRANTSAPFTPAPPSPMSAGAMTAIRFTSPRTTSFAASARLRAARAFDHE